jgi:hypothetical protein
MCGAPVAPLPSLPSPPLSPNPLSQGNLSASCNTPLVLTTHRLPPCPCPAPQKLLSEDPAARPSAAALAEAPLGSKAPLAMVPSCNGGGSGSSGGGGATKSPSPTPMC